MNKFKKIGLTALAASLVSVSANAGELTATGSASITAEGYSGAIGNSGATAWSMGNSVNFNGSTELDNGLTVSMAFELDQGTANNSSNGFDNHSVTISSDSLGSVKFSGHGGSSATSALVGSAAGGLWDNFDGVTKGLGTGTIPDAIKSSGGGNNTFFYTSPEVVDGMTVTASWNPAASAGVNSMLGLGVNYTGIEGLSVSYATMDVEGHDSTTEGDETALKASYAYGPITVSYSSFDHDIGAATSATNLELDSMAVSYTVSDELSLSYGTEESTAGTANSVDAEYTGFTVAYTAGGMTLTGKMIEGENVNHANTAGDDVDYWSLGASFAF
jgi:outer membrane protein OmpU